MLFFNQEKVSEGENEDVCVCGKDNILMGRKCPWISEKLNPLGKEDFRNV